MIRVFALISLIVVVGRALALAQGAADDKTTDVAELARLKAEEKTLLKELADANKAGREHLTKKKDVDLTNQDAVKAWNDKRLELRKKLVEAQAKLQQNRERQATLSSASSDFKVPRGQLTFDAEGAEGGTFHSRKPHVPTDSSGLTIGRGYDMKERTAEQIAKHLTDAGLTPANARLYAGAAGLSGAKARDYIAANKLPEITPEQQKKLFEISFSEAASDVQRICSKEDVVEKYGKVEWSKLHPALQEILVDLRFRGDYTPKSREVVQGLIVANDLPGLAKVLAESDKWPGVPTDRFNRRRAFAQAATSTNP